MGSTEWAVLQIVGPAPAADWNKVNFGVMQSGTGFALMLELPDDVPGDWWHFQVARTMALISLLTAAGFRSL